MKAFFVSYFGGFDGERYTFPQPYLFLGNAESHKRYLEKAGAVDPAIAEMEINHISKQKILIAGDIAGYQFSRTKMGQRTVTRKVYNIIEYKEGVQGIVHWKGRVLKVHLEDSLRTRWVAIKIDRWEK